MIWTLFAFSREWVFGVSDDVELELVVLTLPLALLAAAAVTVLVAWGTLILEIGYPIYTWVPWTKRIWAWAMIGMHAGIGVAMPVQDQGPTRTSPA